MTVSITTSPLNTLKTQALIIPVPEGRDDVLPEPLNALVPKAAHQSFAGKADEVLVVFPAKGAIERIILVGLGDGKGTRTALELFRRSLGLGVRQVAKLKLEELSIYLGGIFTPEYVLEAAYIAEIAPYSYERHKTGKTETTKQFSNLQLVAEGEQITAAHRTALKTAGILGQAVIQARNLINEPSNHLTPAGLADTARKVTADEPTLGIQIFSTVELAKRNFGALLAVAQGSTEEAQLITLMYTPKTKAKRTVALVGKGVTFDTGGVNLKPTPHIGGMHMDMAGGAAVIAAVNAAAALDLPVKVIGIIPATENMVGGKAMKPGDVVVSRSGLTIEVANTDAEGRMILADALSWAGEFGPDLIVDIATLTGATIIALGEERAAVLGNDQALIDSLQDIGTAAGELTWQLPLDDFYRAHVKSEVADVKNMGEGRQADTIAGAAFLEHFIPQGTPWAHIDIAGAGMRTKPGPYWPKNGSGWGVRLLIDFLWSVASL